ncbi:DNA ligase [Clarias magur]|uniref:DNA ligase n=1 Tax=Clarias magur TaxID=1594786 RepID=A0A8J4XH66_CLAMG|nr:DNA ligase [Clarias magur]
MAGDEKPSQQPGYFPACTGWLQELGDGAISVGSASQSVHRKTKGIASSFEFAIQSAVGAWSLAG